MWILNGEKDSHRQLGRQTGRQIVKARKKRSLTFRADDQRLTGRRTGHLTDVQKTDRNWKTYSRKIQLDLRYREGNIVERK